ncbi:MAG: hypothetical protein DDG58_03270 [Ardenticatenia bacterium]|jgi:hypothetical protein|nr:MAG: hypothetical protein DDG58_03270 [Ardenticatenia bacterium]
MAEPAYREGYAMHWVRARGRLVCTYHELGSIRATARTWCVNGWRDQTEGAAGLQDRSRCTPAEWEQPVVPAHQATGLEQRHQTPCLQPHCEGAV